jgi:hypothetical protein
MTAGQAAPSIGPRGLGTGLAAAVRSRPVAAHLTLMGALAFSAGTHAGLVPQHLDESPYLGVAFIGAALATTAVAIALALDPGSTWPPRAAALLFAGQIVAYFLFTESITDPTGVITKLVEGAGLAVALLMRPTPELAEQRRAYAPAYVLLVAFAILVAMQASGHHH